MSDDLMGTGAAGRNRGRGAVDYTLVPLGESQEFGGAPRGMGSKQPLEVAPLGPGVPMYNLFRLTLAATVRRINRKLAPEQHRLCKSRPQARRDLGDWYLLDLNRNRILDHHLSPVAMAAELGLLGHREQVE